ncbi:hypothetical protein A3216_12290 [Mycobacterium leprae 7935681]|nr:hypothetical protein A3216_12290 [Mycobacterium leprae 7935681]
MHAVAWFGAISLVPDVVAEPAVPANAHHRMVGTWRRSTGWRLCGGWPVGRPWSERSCLPALCYSCVCPPLCGLAAHPLQVAPILLTWLVFTRFAQRWAVPSTFVVTLSTVVFTHRSGISGPLLSHLNWTSRG